MATSPLGSCHEDRAASVRYIWNEVNDRQFTWTCMVDGNSVKSAQGSRDMLEDLSTAMKEVETTEQPSPLPSSSLLATKATPNIPQDNTLFEDDNLHTTNPQLSMVINMAHGHLNMRNYASASQNVYPPTVTSPVSHNYTHHSGRYVRKGLRWKWDCCERRSQRAPPCQIGQRKHHHLSYRKTVWQCCHATERLAPGCKSGISKNYPALFRWSLCNDEPLSDGGQAYISKPSTTTIAVSL